MNNSKRQIDDFDLQTSAEITNLIKALRLTQSEIGHAKKKSKNPHFRSDYSDIESVLNEAKPILEKNKIAISHFPHGSDADGIFSMTTLVMHESGEWIKSTTQAPLSKLDSQGIGSCQTYLRRYTLQGILLQASEDDDANAASPSAPKSRTAKTAPTKKPSSPKKPSAKKPSREEESPALVRLGSLIEELKDPDNLKTINQDQLKIVEKVFTEETSKPEEERDANLCERAIGFVEEIVEVFLFRA